MDNTNSTPRTDVKAFDYRPNQFGGSSFRHTKYGILVDSSFAQELERELNVANAKIAELKQQLLLSKEVTKLARNGLKQLIDKQ
jgi:uncharacterized phage infection (PIP) family protein YhgE